MESGLLYLENFTLSSANSGWTVPVLIVVLATLLGWAVERLLIRWFRRIERRSKRASETVARVLRGHITFWGLLIGLGIDANLLLSKDSTLLPDSLKSYGNYYSDALLALFITSMTLLVARVAVGLVRLSAASNSRPVISLISNVVWFVTLVIGFLLVLSLLQVNITPWLTTLGVAGLAVSLALQATLTDLISGMMLLGSHQVMVGHYIKLSTGEEGYVLDITWRTTTLRQLSNNEIVIPNSKMTSTTFINYHAPEMKSIVLIGISIANTNDLDRVETICIQVGEEVMREVPGGVPDFAPLVRFKAMTNFAVHLSVILQIHEFVDQYLIKSEYIRRVRKRFSEEGVTMPGPLQALRLADSDGSRAEQPVS
jgi:small-conductance mechanosensitive channel